MPHQTARAWSLWGCAVVVYVAAVFHRGSLGVAGPEAIQRFHVGPAALSTFTVLQVGLYASMQIPTGMLVDRFGPRRVLTTATVLLGAGQLLFAVAHTYALGLLARATLGIGDALTWVSILRVVAAGFTARQYALVTTLSAALGAIGGVAATFPLSDALSHYGWSTTFTVAGLATAGYALLCATLLRDPPPQPTAAKAATPPANLATLLTGLRDTWTVPSTRLSFWVHFSTAFVHQTLAFLWGYPYLVNGLGISPATASLLLSVLIIGQIIGGPLVGTLIGRRPACRMPVVLGYLTCNALAWAVLLGWPAGRPPLAVVAAVFTVFALGGPVSATAFALARDYNPLRQVSTATGIANTAGHGATAVAVLAIGLLLNLTLPTHGSGAYRLAMLAPVAMLLLGLLRTTVWWRRARSVVLAAQARGEHVPVTLRRRRWDLRTTYRAPANAA